MRRHRALEGEFNCKTEFLLQNLELPIFHISSHLCMLGKIDVIDTGRVEINSMEAAGGAVEDLQPRPLLHRQVHQHWLVLELWMRNDNDQKITEYAILQHLCYADKISIPEKLLNAMNLW